MSTYANQLAAHYLRNREFQQAVCIAAAQNEAALDLFGVPQTERADLALRAKTSLDQQQCSAFYRSALDEDWSRKLEKSVVAVFDILGPQELMVACKSVGVTHPQITTLLEMEPARRASLANEQKKQQELKDLDTNGYLKYRQSSRARYDLGINNTSSSHSTPAQTPSATPASLPNSSNTTPPSASRGTLVGSFPPSSSLWSPTAIPLGSTWGAPPPPSTWPVAKKDPADDYGLSTSRD